MSYLQHGDGVWSGVHVEFLPKILRDFQQETIRPPESHDTKSTRGQKTRQQGDGEGGGSELAVVVRVQKPTTAGAPTTRE